MFIKVHRIHNDANSGFYITEVLINVSHITYIRENTNLKTMLKEGRINIGLNPAAEFTDIVLNSKSSSDSISVIGSVHLIESKINRSSKTLLKG